jgi:hypothetical protein
MKTDRERKFLEKIHLVSFCLLRGILFRVYISLNLFSIIETANAILKGGIFYTNILRSGNEHPI